MWKQFRNQFGSMLKSLVVVLSQLHISFWCPDPFLRHGCLKQNVVESHCHCVAWCSLSFCGTCQSLRGAWSPMMKGAFSQHELRWLLLSRWGNHVQAVYFRVAAWMLVYSLCLRQLAAHSSRCRRSLRWVWPLDGDHNGSRLWGVSHHVALQWSLLLLSCCCGCRVSSVARHKLCCVLRFIFVRMAHMLKLSSVEVSWSSVELSSVGHRIASWVGVQLSWVELSWVEVSWCTLS